MDRLQRTMRSAREPLRHVASALAALLLSLAVLSGLARANAHYFYCEAMGVLEADPCAAAAQHNADNEGAAAPTEARPSGCCAVLTFPPLPEGTAVAVPVVAPPALAAILPAPTGLPDGQHATSGARSDRAFERWRRPHPSPGELRAQLMVFLT